MALDIAKKKKSGRPPKIDDGVLAKLDYAFGIGCSDIEACLYADISSSTLYRYFENNPEYRKHTMELKNKPVLKARVASDKLIESGDPVHVRWFLERRKSDEFTARHDISVESTGSLSIESRSDALSEFLSRFNPSDDME